MAKMFWTSFFVLAALCFKPDFAAAIPVGAASGDSGLLLWDGPIPGQTTTFLKQADPAPPIEGDALVIDFGQPGDMVISFLIHDTLLAGDYFRPLIDATLGDWTLQFFDQQGFFHGILSGLSGIHFIDIAIPVTTCGENGNYSNCVAAWNIAQRSVPEPVTAALLLLGLLGMMRLRRNRPAVIPPP